MKELIIAVDLDGIRKALTENPALANEGIPFDEKNPAKAHPLHRLADGVFNGVFTDKDAVEMAKIFLAFGAAVDGFDAADQLDTPLIAAASLHAEELGIFYIENGADIHRGGCAGGTALHWAAWVGRDKLVARLLSEKADIYKKDTEHEGTPLLWAVHGYKFSGDKNRHHQVECVRLLLAAGSDKTTTNIEGTPSIGFLEKEDTELIRLLS